MTSSLPPHPLSSVGLPEEDEVEDEEETVLLLLLFWALGVVDSKDEEVVVAGEDLQEELEKREIRDEIKWENITTLLWQLPLQVGAIESEIGN